MKIVLFVTGLQLGGAETQVADLARGFLARGHDVTLISVTGPCTIALPQSPRFTLVELKAGKSPGALLGAMFRFVAYLREWQPDVVHAHMVHANLMARVARWFVRMPVLVSSAHSRNEGGRARMLAYRLTDRWTDLTTNVSDDAVAAFVAQGAAPAERIVSVPNGIDTRRYRPDAQVRSHWREMLLGQKQTDVDVDANAATPIVFAAGRIAEAKDYPTLVKAFERVLDLMPQARLLIAGDGPSRASVQTLIDTRGLARSVSLLGRRNDVAQLMCAADVYVMSSAWEGLPLVIGEAMATCLPVVSTDCGGVRELLGDIQDNTLVPIGDASALGNALIRHLSHTVDESRAIGTANRERIVACYSLDAIVAQWLDIYARLAAPCETLR
ncbi:MULTISPECIES: glycosyltransferase [Pandoraea]|uniref:glycosyltransferase n=1 Tax=Pandoraea TaxID=93217 RepID=UPI001F5D7F4F|nr:MULTISPECIES: glycosyltransferase [Pandoraea]MCI3203697.1 glycosyl transferase [Pandoraea sp. LA3]MDN4581723.1 glycosyl transferase [Pandoraea capi]